MFWKESVVNFVYSTIIITTTITIVVVNLFQLGLSRLVHQT